jgi:hypothetical protein
VRRAERETGLGHATATRRADRERDTEVGHHRLARVQQDVLRLDVAVDDVALVRVLERARHRLGNMDRLVDFELALEVQAGAQRLPFDVRHHVIEKRVRFAGVEERQDVRVLKRRGGLDLGDEALGADHGGELGSQHLHRDLAPVLQIVGEVYRGHAARAELRVQLVAVGERAAKALRN